MSVFDKMLDVMRLNDDEEEFYDEDFDDFEEEEPVKKGFFFRKTGTDDIEESIPVSTTHSGSARASARGSAVGGVTSKITPMRSSSSRKRSGVQMEVCVIKPQSFEDAGQISETLLAGRTVILNMEGLDLALAQRLIDFISGSCYAIDGNLQRISNYIFVVTPNAVGLSGDLQEIVDSFGFAGLQTGF